MLKYIYQILILLGCLTYAQQTYVDYDDNVSAPLTTKEMAKLTEVFGSDATYVMERPTLLKGLKDLMRNRIKIQKIPGEKIGPTNSYSRATSLSEVPLYDVFNPNLIHDVTYRPSDFNLLKYRVELFPSEPVIYKLNDYYITVLPQRKKDR